MTVILTHKPYLDSAQVFKGYWIYSNGASSLTLKDVVPNVSSTEFSYPLSDLLFRNDSSGEIKNLSEAVDLGWVQGNSINDVIWYWNSSLTTENKWKFISEFICDEDFPDQCIGGPENIGSWEGYFIKGSKKDISVLNLN